MKLTNTYSMKKAVLILTALVPLLFNACKKEETPDLEIEIEDDTPPEDRNRRPSEPEFVEKLETLVESYFQSENKVKVAETDSLNEGVEVEDDTTTQRKLSVDPLMEQYAKTISQSLKG